MHKKHRKQLGKHDYDGSCRPGGRDYSASWQTFSVGIFQWVPAKSVGLKRGPVKYRVKGPTAHPEKVYRRAEQLCDSFDNGIEWANKKSETVK